MGMLRSAVILSIATMIVAAVGVSTIGFVPAAGDFVRSATATQSIAKPKGEGLQVVPGRSIGPLRLGEPAKTILRWFPFKNDVDSKHTYSSCSPRSEIEWLAPKGKTFGGIIRFFVRNDRLFQVEVGDPRYRTPEGLGTYSTPDDVRRQYPNLDSYMLIGSGGSEIGGEDLVYWVNQGRGIAFEFYYDRKSQGRLVNAVIIFEATTEFLPHGCVVQPTKWLKLPPSSLELPPDK